MIRQIQIDCLFRSRVSADVFSHFNWLDFNLRVCLCFSSFSHKHKYITLTISGISRVNFDLCQVFPIDRVMGALCIHVSFYNSPSLMRVHSYRTIILVKSGRCSISRQSSVKDLNIVGRSVFIKCSLNILQKLIIFLVNKLYNFAQ